MPVGGLPSISRHLAIYNTADLQGAGRSDTPVFLRQGRVVSGRVKLYCGGIRMEGCTHGLSPIHGRARSMATPLCRSLSRGLACLLGFEVECLSWVDQPSAEVDYLN